MLNELIQRYSKQWNKITGRGSLNDLSLRCLPTLQKYFKATGLINLKTLSNKTLRRAYPRKSSVSYFPTLFSPRNRFPRVGAALIGRRLQVMGEGVTNPTDSAVDGPSVLCAACLKLVLLFSVSYVILLHWRRQRRETANNIDVANEKDNTTASPERNRITCLTGDCEPHLRRSVNCGTVSQLQPVDSHMEPNTSAPPDPQPDSFFTWDSGGNSGDYSFVHTAVELPKYPDGAISEEERQMLLLYMQSGHPELLLNSSNTPVDTSHSLFMPPSTSDNVMCDQATVRGFLETIVEENSDDLKSPSDCDEASVGWGSWDESDDDRVTVVEMETNEQNLDKNMSNNIRCETFEQDNVINMIMRESDQLVPASLNPFIQSSGVQNANQILQNRLDEWKTTDNQFFQFSSATSVNNHAFENCGVMCGNGTAAERAKSSEQNVMYSNTDMDILAKVSQNSDQNDFESLWISANKMDCSGVETVSPWCKNEKHYVPVTPDEQYKKFNTDNHNMSPNMLVLGSADLCLVPSAASDNITPVVDSNLAFSDDFKDYFLPIDACTSTFNSSSENEPVKDVFVTENISANKKMRCFRIGFEAEPTEIVSHTHNYSIADEKSFPFHAEMENSRNSDLQQETLFSPRDGDVVYGSSWLNDSIVKKPEKSSSAAEARFSAVHAESPSPDNIRKSLHLYDQSASDDELQQVPSSLSRWQHHTDLQHVQEATSPITRWQHQSDLANISNDKFLKFDSDEESDGGLPPQLKEIYSSFKMKDKKMGRIRIKEDKNNNFKKLGLWDNEAKVTLPPFITNNTQTEYAQATNNKEFIKEELDDLELDMFSVNKNNLDGKAESSSNADLEVDDALKSFNHLNDYSSNSEENSESENSYTVNTVENIDYDNEEISNPSTPDMSSLKSPAFNTCDNENLKSETENTCSDNSDNCPLCTDPSFKNSKINNIFLNSPEENCIDNNVQSLLLNTFPKLTGLAAERNISDGNGGSDSTSPLTSSDSDEGIKTAKDIKKRMKRRLKDNSNTELKHDDSGYVEDDEDDDEDDSLEEKEMKESIQVLPTISSAKDPPKKIRKSLSSAFYESKSINESAAHSECVPKNFEEFSNQLETTAMAEVKGEIDSEKWNIPENLSQFSAWLLDKELRKINCRDEMEKLIVSDIMSLREQTISQFLKNSSSVRNKNEFSLPAVLEQSECVDHLLSSKNNPSTDPVIFAETEWGMLGRSQSNLSENVVNLAPIAEVHSDSDKTFSDENSGEKIEQSSDELDSEYYNYNFNSNVTKILSPSAINSNSENDLHTSSDICEIISGETETGAKSENQNIEKNEINLSAQDRNELISEKIDIANDERIQSTHSCNPELVTEFCNNNTSSVGETFDTSRINTEALADEKVECATERRSDGDNTEREKKVKVICTTTSVTSYKEAVEGNDSTLEFSVIDNVLTPSDSKVVYEVTPSIDRFSNYAESNEINSGNTLNEEKHFDVSETFNETQIKSNDRINNSIANNTTKGTASLLISSSEGASYKNFIKDDGCEITESKQNTEDELLSEKTDEENLRAENNILQSVDHISYREVAPSTDDTPNCGDVTPGNEVDLMTCDTREEKGAYEGFSSDIILLQAEAVSKEVDAAEHVTNVDYHAYDELACVTHPSVNDNLCTSLPTQGVAVGSLSHTEFENVILNCGSEELSYPLDDRKDRCDDWGKICNFPVTTVSEELLPKDSIFQSSSEFNQEETKVSESFLDNNISGNDTIISESFVNSDNSHQSNLYKSKSVTVLQVEELSNDENDEQLISNDDCKLKLNNFSQPDLLDSEFDKISFSKSSENFNSDIGSEDIDKNVVVSQIKSSDDLSIRTTKEKREEYKRSRSVSRDNSDKQETFETWNGQSKSTPDLSRCHDQHLNSSVPLSALLSKSVSQRIQDYLGKSSKGSVVTRSLPPNERSRHYRRICVSTETVVERAARFEARSKSSGRESSVDRISTRSGSCPPLNMRTSDVLKNVRNFGKPTATVRPTVDIYRNSREHERKMVYGEKKNEEDLFELITGYNKATKVTHKPPPVPLQQPQQGMKSARIKGKIASARKEFFERLSQQDLRPKPETKQTSDVDEDDGTCGLRRFNEFRKSAREERARLAQSHPDLGALEAAVRSSRRRIDQLKKRRQKAPPLDTGPQPSSDTGMPVTATTTTKDGTLVLPYRRCTGEIAWASCAKRLQEAKARSESKSQEPLEIVDERRFKCPAERIPLRAHDYENAADEDYDDPGPAISGSDFSRARSMDFLLDNREGAEPPENRLAQRVKSEHELRIERSLQNLTLPDWYTQSKKPKEGFILRRGSEGSAGESRKRWLGFSSSRTPSATSLTTPPSSYSHRNIVVPKRVTPTSSEWRYIGSLVSSRESLTPASPASLSPRECSSAAFNYGMNASLSRWSSSRLSTSSAPLTSLSVHRSFRQPYLGWRAAAASSGGASRSSPGVSPINATTPVQVSRPGSPRRGSQDHQYGYGLQQNQITSAATLRPDGNETGDSGSRISPLALYDNSTNVFFNSNIEVPDYSTSELRRDRYSYTQSLYSGSVIVSPGTEFKPVPSIAEDTSSSTTDDRFSMSKSPQPPPRIWMESSFVGTKKDGKDQVPFPQGRTIRIVPSDSVRSGDPSKSGGSSVRSTCAPQTAMGEYVLRDFRRFGITL